MSNLNSQNTILIIEDDHELSSLYEQVLQDNGYIVITASDGESGFDCILDNKWDLLLLDIMLPKKDGLEILKELKEYNNWKKGKVLMMTNLNNLDIINTSFDLGADGYLIKSQTQPDVLLQEIQTHLALK